MRPERQSISGARERRRTNPFKHHDVLLEPSAEEHTVDTRAQAIDLETLNQEAICCVECVQLLDGGVAVNVQLALLLRIRERLLQFAEERLGQVAVKAEDARRNCHDLGPDVVVRGSRLEQRDLCIHESVRNR